MKRRTATAWLFALVLARALPAAAQERPAYPPTIPEARVETFKNVDGVALNVWILVPDGHQASDSRVAMVFFFGGGFVRGTPSHFERQARALRSRGMVTILADYRVFERNNTKAVSAVEDAKSAIRWVRAHAHELGVDPLRIGAGGGSSGGHLAAATATIPGFEGPGEDVTISSAPNALVLFNPVLVVAPLEGVFELGPDHRYRQRMGAPLLDLSPFHQVGANTPPTLVMHGTEDQTVPFVTVQAYCERVAQMGGECQLVPYQGAGHGFFNSEPYYERTLLRMTQFLEALGWLRRP